MIVPKTMKSKKYVQDTCTEIYEIPMREIKDLKKWRDIPAHRLGDSMLLSCQCF